MESWTATTPHAFSVVGHFSGRHSRRGIWYDSVFPELSGPNLSGSRQAFILSAATNPGFRESACAAISAFRVNLSGT